MLSHVTQTPFAITAPRVLHFASKPNQGGKELQLVDASLTRSTDHHCTASRMNGGSDNGSESSLPTHPANLPSSPPIFKQRETPPKEPEEMDSQSRVKSEPLATQHGDAARPSSRRVSSEDTERPPSAQQVQKDTDDDDDDDDDDAAADENHGEEDEEDLDSDPAQSIEDFDWDDLHSRYHEAMKDCHSHESELTNEWQSLMNYFSIWAESGHEQETGRTFQRLKTRTAFVQGTEAKLEHKRNHYIDVVKAFESALNLLKAQGYGH